MLDTSALRASIIKSALRSLEPKPKPMKPTSGARKTTREATASPTLEPGLPKLTVLPSPIARGALTRHSHCPLCGRVDEITVELGLWYPSGKFARHFTRLETVNQIEQFLALPLTVDRLEPIDRECPDCLRLESTIENHLSSHQVQLCLFL